MVYWDYMRNYALITLLVACVILASSAKIARAQTPYGGSTITFIPCTASGPAIYLIYYVRVAGITPLWYDALQLRDADDPNHGIPSFPLLGLEASLTVPCFMYVGTTVITIGYGFPVIL